MPFDAAPTPDLIIPVPLDTAEQGAVYLDRIMPGWAQRINLLQLDMRCNGTCVLGLYRRYRRVQARYRRRHSRHAGRHQRREVVKAWTDYPIESLGDKPGKLAPVRRCFVVNYDGNKYCDIAVQGVFFPGVKRGYIYKRQGRSGEVPSLTHRGACRLPRRP